MKTSSAILMHAAAVRRRDELAARVQVLREREARDIAASVERKAGISEGGWKERHALEARHRATCGVVDALQEILATSNL